MCSAWDVRGSLTQVSLFGNLRVLTSAHDSPKLIAVYYVLHRHLTPRHPPYALSSFLKHDAEKLKFVSRLLHFFITSLLLLLYSVGKVQTSSPIEPKSGIHFP